MTKRPKTPEIRFANRTNISSIRQHKGTYCIEWTGTITSTGYGRFFDGQRSYAAHRWSYEQAFGSIPDGLHIDHLCRNRRCVNPRHLEAVTPAENAKRAWAGRGLNAQCSNGHPRTPKNTRVTHRGDLICRACDNIRKTAKRDKTRTRPYRPMDYREKTGLCGNGHLAAPETLRMTRRGTLACRICDRNRKRAARARARAEQSAASPGNLEQP